MVTLQNFYKSKKWERLTRQIRMERVNEDGELICWHCGKPIVRAYDCICHHTVFLTEENVNRAEIALNPDLIKCCHHVCHNRIHEKGGYKGFKREVFLVYGSPLSGKTTWVKENALPGDLVVEMDSIWECVSAQPRYEKPMKLNAVVFSVRDCLMDAVKHRLGKWNNAYIVGGYPLISERERICKEYGAREIFIDCDKETCLERLHDADDRDIEKWEGYIETWWRRYAPGV